MTERETRTALPSTPVAARRGWVQPAPRRSRLELVIWATAVLFGSTIGGTLALRAEPATAAEPAASAPANPEGAPAVNPAGPAGGTAPAGSSGGATAANPVGGAGALPPAGGGAAATAAGGGAAATPVGGAPAAMPAGGPAPTTDPLRAAAIGQISDALRRFVSWSHRHAGARCPDATALGAHPDPWGHALRITCTDQPADQIAGAVSAGPDGVPGTRDDLESWTLGDAVTDPVRGPRWRVGRPGSRRTDGAAAPIPQPTKPASPGAGSSDNDGDGIPDRR